MKKRFLRFITVVAIVGFVAPSFVSAQVPPTCTLTVNPTSINKGQTFGLKWTSANATGGTIIGVGKVGPSGTKALIVTKSTVFTGTFIGPGGTAKCQATITENTYAGSPVPAETLQEEEIIDGDSFQAVTPPTYTPDDSGSLPSYKPSESAGVSGAGLVPCDGLNCQACHLAKLSQNVINFLIGISIPLAAALFAYAGVLMFTAGDNSNRIDKAKEILKKALIGFLIILSAWLVVQTIFKAILSDAYYKGWNNIQCVAEANRPKSGSISGWLGSILPGLNTNPLSVAPPESNANNITVGGCTGGDSLVNGPNGTAQCWDGKESYYNPQVGASTAVNERFGEFAKPGSSAGSTCPGCVAMNAGFQVKNNNQVSEDFNTYLNGFADNLGGMDRRNIAVTEAWPPTANHSATCHYNGTCVDIAFRGVSYNNQTVSQVQTAAQAAGGCAVFETNPSTGCMGIQNCKVYSHVTAPHFSLYNNPSCRGR